MFSVGLFLKKMMVGCMIQICYFHTLEMAEHQEFHVALSCQFLFIP